MLQRSHVKCTFFFSLGKEKVGKERDARGASVSGIRIGRDERMSMQVLGRRIHSFCLGCPNMPETP